MNQQDKQPKLFFHVGLGKVASTYLQYRFFPKLKDITYIQRTRYRRFHQIIQKSNQSKFLLSREFDQQLEDEIKKVAPLYPAAKIIILLRRHDSWIASQYRRHVKNGSPKLFTDFFDVDQDTGLWKESDLLFYPKLKLIEAYFQSPPLVLFHEDLKQDPYAFFDALANYMGASYSRDDVSLQALHKSYNTKQLKIMRKVSRVLFPNEPNWSSNRFLKWIQRRSRLWSCYAILYPSLLLPNSWISTEPLIPSTELDKIREKYTPDWEKCKEYASAVNVKLKT